MGICSAWSSDWGGALAISEGVAGKRAWAYRMGVLAISLCPGALPAPLHPTFSLE